MGTCAAAILSYAAPQGASDADIRAREYIQFLVLQLDQWTRDLPQAYNQAMLLPPVDVSKLSDAEKACAVTLRENMQRLVAVSHAPDLQINHDFRAQLEKTIQAAVPVNTALAKQRFPEGIEADWVHIRTTLNSLAAIYKFAGLPVLNVSAPGKSP